MEATHAHMPYACTNFATKGNSCARTAGMDCVCYFRTSDSQLSHKNCKKDASGERLNYKLKNLNFRTRTYRACYLQSLKQRLSRQTMQPCFLCNFLHLQTKDFRTSAAGTLCTTFALAKSCAKAAKSALRALLSAKFARRSNAIESTRTISAKGSSAIEIARRRSEPFNAHKPRKRIRQDPLTREIRPRWKFARRRSEGASNFWWRATSTLPHVARAT